MAWDAVARGAELFDNLREIGPRDAAAQAQKEKRALVRTAPAIVAGERRMFRVFDVPLGESGVAGFAFGIEVLEPTPPELVRCLRAQRDPLARLLAGAANLAPNPNRSFLN